MPSFFSATLSGLEGYLATLLFGASHKDASLGTQRPRLPVLQGWQSPWFLVRSTYLTVLGDSSTMGATPTPNVIPSLILSPAHLPGKEPGGHFSDPSHPPAWSPGSALTWGRHCYCPGSIWEVFYWLSPKLGSKTSSWWLGTRDAECPQHVG